MIKVQRHVGRPFIAQVDVAIKGQVCSFEIGATGEVKLGALGYGFDAEIAGALLVECYVAQLDFGIDRRFFERAGALRGEIHAALDSEAAGLQLGDAAKIEILSREVETEGLA